MHLVPAVSRSQGFYETSYNAQDSPQHRMVLPQMSIGSLMRNSDLSKPPLFVRGETEAYMREGSSPGSQIKPHVISPTRRAFCVQIGSCSAFCLHFMTAPEIGLSL